MSLFGWFAGLFAKTAGPGPGPGPADCCLAPQIAGPPRTMPPPCPFCGGAGKTLVGIVEPCDCRQWHCEGARVRGGPGKSCAICAGTRVVPAALLRAQLRSDCWLGPLQAYARAAAGN